MLWAADETALDLFARRPTRGFLTGLRFVDAPVSVASSHGGRVAESDGFQPRHVVELSGDEATPTTLVLLHVLAAFLTQRGSTQEQSKVFVFDHECELAASLLLRIVSDKLKTTVEDQTERKALARRLLERVIVFHCRDSFQWLATLNKVHFDLLEAPPASCLLVIHSVGSFHAIDKMVAKSVGSGLALADQVFLILKQFIRQHSPIVFASKPTQSNVRGTWDSPEYLQSSWSSQVSKRIQLRLIQGDRDPERAGEKQFEARSFVHGKSRMLSFRAEGLALIDDKLDESVDFQPSLPDITMESQATTVAIAQADTNAAQLWKR